MIQSHFISCLFSIFRKLWKGFLWKQALDFIGSWINDQVNDFEFSISKKVWSSLRRISAKRWISTTTLRTTFRTSSKTSLLWNQPIRIINVVRIIILERFRSWESPRIVHYPVACSGLKLRCPFAPLPLNESSVEFELFGKLTRKMFVVFLMKQLLWERLDACWTLPAFTKTRRMALFWAERCTNIKRFWLFIFGSKRRERADAPNSVKCDQTNTNFVWIWIKSKFLDWKKVLEAYQVYWCDFHCVWGTVFYRQDLAGKNTSL